MASEQQVTEMILEESLKKIRMHKMIFRKIKKECVNHVPVGAGCGRCTRRYHKNPGPIKHCEYQWCPLLGEV